MYYSWANGTCNKHTAHLIFEGRVAARVRQKELYHLNIAVFTSKHECSWSILQKKKETMKDSDTIRQWCNLFSHHLSSSLLHPHFFASHCYWMLPNTSVFQQTAVLSVYVVSIQLYMYVWSCVKTLMLHVLLIAHTWLCILKDISNEWDHAKNKCVMCTLYMLWFGFVFQMLN